MNKKIAIYGGTFSPPHVGHLHAASAFLRQESPDMLYVIPANIPPHKKIISRDNPQLRLRMTELAFSTLEGYGDSIVVSDFELRQGGPSYSIYTIEHFAKESPNLSMLCGTDMMLSLDTWYRAEDIFRLADIVYIRREKEVGMTEKLIEKCRFYREKYNARIRHIDVEPLVVSSEQLRARLSAGEDCSAFIPEPVLDFIRQNNLYGYKRVDDR